MLLAHFLEIRITGVLDFVHRPGFYILKNTTFQKLDVSVPR
jgi:hypothetical protein